jgi:6-phosphogluconolactonase (cycloisomerase 2 family)
VPPGFAGTNFASEIRVSDDGNHVYGANRLNDTIGVFSIGPSGRRPDAGMLTPVSHASMLGDYPRTFAIDPSGQFMAVANQRADNITTFRVTDGTLAFTGNFTPVGSPSGMAFLI